MSERSGEKTKEKSTEEILAETDKLLSDLEGGDTGSADQQTGSKRDKRKQKQSRKSQADDGLDVDLGIGGDSRSKATKQQSSSSGDAGWKHYFNPKSFLLVGLLLTVGFVAGGFAPLGGIGAWFGMVIAAFAYGLGTSNGRYAETAVAGGGVGLLTALVNNMQFAFLPNGQWFLAFGAFLGLLGGVVGYYFGSDLRNGLTGDPDDFDDEPSW
ncbi:hypothetical protein [Haloarchaeobius sp. DFWS5]|uniref:hypothetical protein n=1 Tax=Haloarchaeobius sp. DFWS5 TaxID=3446114 RepID=UPI003EBE289F